MGTFKKLGAGLFATALLAGVLTSAPSVAFADDEVPATQVSAKAGTPVGAAATSKCEVKISVPKTLKSTSARQTFAATTDGNESGCVGEVQVDLYRVSDDRHLTGVWADGNSEAYYRGAIAMKLPWPSGFNFAGKYYVSVSAKLDEGWAYARGLDPRRDYPNITIGNGVMDLRHGVEMNFKATRKIEGVAMRGSAWRFAPETETGGWNDYYYLNKAQVKLQKKVGSKWVTKKTVRTNSSGSFAATIKDKSKATWRAQVQATSKNWSAHRSATVAKQAKGKAKTKISRSYDGWSDRFSGTVKFNAGGGYYAAPKSVKIAVQKKSGSKWKTIKTIKTNSSGQYGYSTSKAGSYRFVVKGTSKYVSKTSAAHKII